MTARLLRKLARLGGSRPRLVLVTTVLLALGAGALALGLQPTAATSSFVSSSSPEYRATQRFYRDFGEEPIAIAVHGDLQQLVLSSDIVRLVGLEGCLSGNVPAKALAQEGGARGPCGRLARLGTVKVVLGPGTFVAEAANQIDEVLARETALSQRQAQLDERDVYRAALKRGYSPAGARRLGQEASRVAIGRFEEYVATLALQYGLTAKPSLTDRNFVSQLVFDPAKPAGTPKQRFAYLFPSRDIALISVRMRAGLSQAARNRTIALVRQAVAMPQWHLAHGERYLVTGEPVIVSDLTSSIVDSIRLLLAAAVLVMALALALVFRGRPRLLPLLLALIGVALTFGALSVVGASLTVASIAVLPVLIGLAVDYAIQFQSRVGEEGEEAGVRGVDQVVRAMGLGGGAILAAAAASAAAMLALLLSPVPMVRGFAALLIAGIAIALLCTLLAGSAAMSLAASSSRRGVPGAFGAGPLGAAWRGARELLADNPLTRLVARAALVRAPARPGRVVALGLALALAGWGLDTQTRVETDIAKLVPQSLGSLQGLQTLERETGVGGEVALLISGRDAVSPATIEWMSAYQSTVLSRLGYSSQRGCGKAQLCPAFSLPDLFQGPTAAGASSGAKHTLTEARVRGLLSVIPSYFSQDVITADRRTATLSFGIRLMSLSRQQRLIESMRSELHPPAGVRAELVGLPVLAAQSGTEVADPWRRLLTLICGLAAVALVLLAAFRGDARRALVPLAPIALATGWSALVLFALRVPLNPMSVTLGALVIAISTEFSVLLSERYRQERLAGHDSIEALRRSYHRTGAAVAASGVTAIAGFGVLTLSDIRMLRDFGLVTLVDLTVALLGVLVVLPAALTLGERSYRRAGAVSRPWRRQARGIDPPHEPA